MKTAKAVFVFAILISVFSVFTAFAAEWTPEQREVIAFMDAWDKAFLSGDKEKLSELLSDELDFTSRTLRGTYRDKTSFLKAYQQWYAFSSSTPTSIAISYEKIEIDENKAIVVKNIHWTVRGDRGVQQGTNIKTNTLRKIEGKWKIYSEK